MNRREFNKTCALAAMAALSGAFPIRGLAQTTTPSARPTPYILGADISFLLEDETSGATYWDRGVQKDLLAILKYYGFNYIRTRIFVNPHAPGGYSARKPEAFCDLEHVKKLATRVKAAGMGLLVSCHYSDTWSSPGHQTKPAAWADLPFNKLVDTVHDWTANVLAELKANQTPPDMVSIGNETTDGVLFPDGKISNLDQFARLINAGCQAVREFNRNTLIAVHSHLGRDNAAVVQWVDGFLDRKTDFDVIGMSCYSQAHPGDWEHNFNDLSVRYPHLWFAALEYSYEKRALNDLIFKAPNARGLGSFSWEPTRWREAIFDHLGQNAGNDENNRPHLPPSTLPSLDDPNQPVYRPAHPPSYANVDGNAATTRLATTAPVIQPTTRPRVAGGRPRTGGRYDTNSYILAYPEMAKAYGGGKPDSQQ